MAARKFEGIRVKEIFNRDHLVSPMHHCLRLVALQIVQLVSLVTRTRDFLDRFNFPAGCLAPLVSPILEKDVQSYIIKSQNAFSVYSQNDESSTVPVPHQVLIPKSIWH